MPEVKNRLLSFCRRGFGRVPKNPQWICFFLNWIYFWHKCGRIFQIWHNQWLRDNSPNDNSPNDNSPNDNSANWIGGQFAQYIGRVVPVVLVVQLAQNIGRIPYAYLRNFGASLLSICWLKLPCDCIYCTKHRLPRPKILGDIGGLIGSYGTKMGRASFPLNLAIWWFLPLSM